MGQPVSRGLPTTSPFPRDAPFENYQVYTGNQGQPGGYPQGPNVYPAPPQRGLRQMPPQMDDGMWGDDDDPVYLPEQRGGFRRRPGGFDPFLNGSPQGYPPQDSVTRGPGLAQDMISRMRMKQQVEPAGRAVQYRSAPPRSAYPPQQQGYAPQQQSYAPQPQSYGQQQFTGGQQPVMYYDPKTGAIANPPQITPQTAPQYTAYPPGMMGFPQAQGQNPFMFPGMPNMSFMMPQAQQQQQPIVIPGQLYTRDGGMHQLG